MSCRETKFCSHDQIDIWLIIFRFVFSNLQSAMLDRLILTRRQLFWIDVVIDSSRVCTNVKKMTSILKSSMKYREKTWYYRVERDCNNIYIEAQYTITLLRYPGPRTLTRCFTCNKCAKREKKDICVCTSLIHSLDHKLTKAE